MIAIKVDNVWNNAYLVKQNMSLNRAISVVLNIVKYATQLNNAVNA